MFRNRPRRLAFAVAVLVGAACAKGTTGLDDDSQNNGGNGVGGASVGGAGGGNQGSGATSASSSSSAASGGAGGASSSSSSGAAGGAGPSCGDQVCSAGESCTTCPGDCPGLADCDGNPSNGCECAASAACCASSCETQHSNGLGQFFFDCLPLNTHDAVQATKAANVWPTAGTIINAGCTGPGMNEVVCKQGAGSCACWGSVGSNSGHVHLNATSSTCNCPTTSDPPWS